MTFSSSSVTTVTIATTSAESVYDYQQCSDSIAAEVIAVTSRACCYQYKHPIHPMLPQHKVLMQ
jgi:trehalose-6-phosphate synthase